MILGLSLISMLRRWFIVVPGLLAAVALAAGAWFVVPATYQRTATLLLVPGAGTVPEEGNPYFYLGGLTQAADVLVRAVGSENTRRDIKDQYPGVAVQVTRDPTTAGPVIVLVAEAENDADAGSVLALLVKRAGDDLRDLQAVDRILPSDRIQVRAVSIDDHSTLRDRTRMVVAAGVGAFVVLLTVLAAAVVEFRANRRSRPDLVSGDERDERQSRSSLPSVLLRRSRPNSAPEKTSERGDPEEQVGPRRARRAADAASDANREPGEPVGVDSETEARQTV